MQCACTDDKENFAKVNNIFKKYKAVRDLNIHLELRRLSDDLNIPLMSQRPVRSRLSTDMVYHVTAFLAHSVVKWKQL
jgi:hypothetical protein